MKGWQHFGRVAAGVATWAVVFGLTVASLTDRTDALAGRMPPAVTLQVALLVTLLTATRRDLPAALRSTAFAAHAPLALLLGLLLPFDWLQIHTLIWLAMVPSFIADRRGQLLLLVGVVAAWYLVGTLRWHDPATGMQTLLWSTFHLFALVSARETLAAHAARDRAAALNRELLGTQQLLAEASRAGERARIARDLHDMLGHHLTALSIKLQVAARTADGPLQRELHECHALSRLLLSDVRETVGELRNDAGLDLSQALRSLAHGTPHLNITLEIPSPVAVEHVDAASAVLRFVQEAITNTLRHAGADGLWIRARHEGANLAVEVWDNGRVSGELVPGHGITGMRERAAAVGGEMCLGRRDGALHLTLRVPAATPAA